MNEYIQRENLGAMNFITGFATEANSMFQMNVAIFLKTLKTFKTSRATVQTYMGSWHEPKAKCRHGMTTTERGLIICQADGTSGLGINNCR